MLERIMKTISPAIAVAAAMLWLLPGSAAAQGYDDWNPDLPGYPSNTIESPRANCAGGGDQCIERTIGEMWRRFHTEIPTCENNNVFSLTYLRVTEDIREAVDSGFYSDLQWINQQDAMFARIYFLNYENWVAGRTELVPESWRMTFDAAHEGRVQGLGNLLMSMNAHVQRDFPFVLYHAGLVNPDGSTKKPDHDAYNARLRALYKPMLTELAQRFDASMDDYDIPGVTADDDAFFSLLIQWRETAWQYATDLTEAAGDAERRQIAAEIEANANAWAQLIRAGSSYLPGQSTSARDARCAEFGGQDPGYDRGAEVARPLKRAKLSGAGLTARLRCPNGVGPCIGRLRVRGRGLRGSEAYELPAGERARVRIEVQGNRVRSGAAPRRVRVVARSKLGPGVAVTKHRRTKLRLAG